MTERRKEIEKMAAANRKANAHKTDEQRLEEFHKILMQPEIMAVFKRLAKR